jgi:hypothetical protein
VAQRALKERFRRHAAVFGQYILLQASAVDADADGYALSPAGLRNGAHVRVAADIARIDPDLVGARLGGRDGQLIVEVNVRDNRDGDAVFELSDGARRRHVRHGDAHEFAAGVRKPPDLRCGPGNVPRVRSRHGLHAHRRAAADTYAADADALSSHGRFSPRR